jgi:predicted flavoprotein YhiN
MDILNMYPWIAFYGRRKGSDTSGGTISRNFGVSVVKTRAAVKQLNQTSRRVASLSAGRVDLAIRTKLSFVYRVEP